MFRRFVKGKSPDLRAIQLNEVFVNWSARRLAEVFSLTGVLSGVLVGSASLAHAQGTSSGTSAELRPPELLERAQAEYPEEARNAGLEANVGLRLTIDVQGRVAEAIVTEPAGHGFDEAAQEALRRFRFAPALRGGQPVQARLHFVYEFKLPPPPPVAEPEPSAEPPTERAASVAPAVATTTLAPETAREATAPTAVDVQVRGKLSEPERLQQSAEAVTVVDLKKAKQQTVDMGEVLARTQGVSVRRYGGLGSNARISMNGLYDDQIRLFLDGIPLDLAGYPFGIENVPVNLVDRVEVYRGVVPVRFGADALGGAINLVSDQRYQNHLAASYQVGSFGIHRFTANGRYRDQTTGLFVGGAAFIDQAKNNYPVDVQVPDERGRLSSATVLRFHDGYKAAGGSIEVGIVDRPWAKRLILRGFLSGYDKQLQNNLVMTVPYGEVHYGETVVGTTALYEVELRPNLGLELVANYSHRAIDFVDTSMWVYDWYGRRIRERRVPGEISSDATDQTEWQNSGYGRATATWRITPQHILRASVSPTYTTRTGDDRVQADPNARDPLTAKRNLFTFVSGVEYEANLFGERLSNIVFVKDYYYAVTAEDPLPGGVFKPRDSTIHEQGIGDSLRYRFNHWFYAKASYEYATRLPRPDEVFGNAALIHANLQLEPEVSHNANIGPRFELRRTSIGDLTLDMNGFLRDSDKLIVLLGNDRYYTYQNVYRARGLGVENAVSWTSIGRYVGLDGTLTWQDVRNASDEGTFKGSKGDRIPNRPYLFASWGAHLRFANLPGPDDTVEPFYNGRYVHGFYRGWESQGQAKFKQVVDSQVTHDIGVSWIVSRDLARVTSTFEIDNVTDARVYDNFGLQRPGRGFYVKVSGEI